VKRTGLGRHGRLDDAVGDPLDGLVNLFDIGMVLAVAFLVAGLGLAVDGDTGRIERRATAAPQREERALPAQSIGGSASGRGEALGTLYRLADGRLVVVEPDGRRRPIDP
jgi:hypothetical protein